MYGLIALLFLFEDLVRYLQRRRPPKTLQQPRLRRLGLARRRARYAAKWKRTRPYTGETQRF